MSRTEKWIVDHPVGWVVAGVLVWGGLPFVAMGLRGLWDVAWGR